MPAPVVSAMAGRFVHCAGHSNDGSGHHREPRMHIVRLCLAALILAGGAEGASAVDWVKPFEVLEQSRRAGIELDKRIAREAEAQRQRERQQQDKRKRDEAERQRQERQEKARLEAQRKREAAAARAAARGAPASPVPTPPAPSPLPSPD